MPTLPLLKDAGRKILTVSCKDMGRDPLPVMLAVVVCFWKPLLAAALLVSFITRALYKDSHGGWPAPTVERLPHPGTLISTLKPPTADSLDPQEVCAVCRDTHKNPLQLPCAHVFCEECLHLTVISAQKYSCLLCSRPLCYPRYTEALRSWIVILYGAAAFLGSLALLRFCLMAVSPYKQLISHVAISGQQIGISAHIRLCLIAIFSHMKFIYFVAIAGQSVVLAFLGAFILRLQEKMSSTYSSTYKDCMTDLVLALLFIWWNLRAIGATT